MHPDRILLQSTLIFFAYLFHGFFNLNWNWIWWPKPFRNKYWGFIYFLWWKALHFIVRFKVINIIIVFFLLRGCPESHQVNFWSSKFFSGFLARGRFKTFPSADTWFNLSQMSPLLTTVSLTFGSDRCCFGFTSVFPLLQWSFWLFSKYQTNTLMKVELYEEENKKQTIREYKYVSYIREISDKVKFSKMASLSFLYVVLASARKLVNLD